MTGFEILGAGISAIGAAQSAGAQAGAYKANAAAAKMQAANIRAAGSAQAADEARKGDVTIGEQTAGFAHAGVFGPSAAQVVGRTRQQADYNSNLAWWNADSQAKGYDYKAQIDEMNAKNAQTAGMFRVGSTVLSSLAGMAPRFMSGTNDISGSPVSYG